MVEVSILPGWGCFSFSTVSTVLPVLLSMSLGSSNPPFGSGSKEPYRLSDFALQK